jgi:hypothetical protein
MTISAAGSTGRRCRPRVQWAPEPIAWRCLQAYGPIWRRSFGFHAVYNFDYGCQGNEDRLMERDRIMAQSGYMTRSNPYLWAGLVKAAPWIEDRMKADGR